MTRLLAIAVLTSACAGSPPPTSRPLIAPGSAADLETQAVAAYHQKLFARSAELYAQAIAAGVDDPDGAYNAACSFALAGDKGHAFDYLARAVDSQTESADQVEQDSDLVSLHGDPRWQHTLAALAKAAAQQKALWDSPGFGSAYEPTLTDDQKVAGLSRVWSEVKYNFVDTGRLGDIGWDSLYFASLPRVRAAATTYEYYRELQMLVAKLADAHSNVYFPDALYDHELGRPGLHTRAIEGAVIVLDVWDPELRGQGIAPGMELVRIDGLPAREFANKNVMPYVSASTPQYLEAATFEYELLAGPIHEPVRLTLRGTDGAVIERTVRRKLETDSKPFTPATRPFELHMLSGNVAQVVLNSFDTDQAADDFIRAFATIASAKALIIDVRGNGGGSSNVGYRVLATLVSEPFATSSWVTREYRPLFRAWGRTSPMSRQPAGQFAADLAHHFVKPVIVLTSARTCSAAEDFVVAFDQSKRGTIIGEPTCGSTGQPLRFALPGGGSGRVRTKLDSYPDGRAFVGVGVVPQVPIHPTIADVRAGRDAVLEAALAYAGQPR